MSQDIDNRSEDTDISIHEFYAACPKGLESLLFQELQQIGVEQVRETVGGVHFSGPMESAYRACLWSRLANKVLMPLAAIPLLNEQSLYEGVLALPWEEHLDPEGTLKVDFMGTNTLIRNTQFGAQRVKDGIVDRIRERTQERPSVDKDRPDLLINARLARGKKGSRDTVHISLDLSGKSLHRRGYRTKQGEAPLKENLAAAVLLRARWPEIAEAGGFLIDPMCGSATLLIEGTLMAADIAPGLFRRHWGFSRWRKFEPWVWSPLLQEALTRQEAGLQRLREQGFEARGYDADPRVLRAAESNITMADLEEFVRVICKSVKEFKRPTHKTMESGLVICNPPYGERLSEERALMPVYRQLGDALKTEFTGWQAGIFTTNLTLSKNMGVRARKRYKLMNGMIQTELLHFILDDKSFIDLPVMVEPELEDGDFDEEFEEGLTPDSPYGASHSASKGIYYKPQVPTLTAGAEMVSNRIKKNLKQLRKWLKREEVECFRVYDADMPEYAAAIDCYGDYVHVQEYMAPKSVDETKARYRFDEILSAVPVALEVPEENIFVKQRQRNKGKQQYEKQDEQAGRAKIRVNEGQATLLVDLWSYLDSGLFLDHRPVRKQLAQMANGKHFLNLFCYTGTATVHAALAGAASSVSVDMSNTYLEWARENFEANNINEERHQLVQENCISWLNQCRQGFDLIFLDPPSFSNSKRMEDIFDVQRDHAKVIHRCMDLLNPGGTLVFSNNLRSFSLDKEISDVYQVDDVTAKTLDPDFQRNKKIHQCFHIKAN